MVARNRDGSDWVKVVDFGIAKTVREARRRTQKVTTPASSSARRST